MSLFLLITLLLILLLLLLLLFLLLLFVLQPLPFFLGQSSLRLLRFLNFGFKCQWGSVAFIAILHLFDLFLCHVVLGIEGLLFNDSRVLLEALWHLKVPDSFMQLILNVRVVVSTICPSAMNDHTLQLVLTVFGRLKCLRVQVSTDVELKRELKLVIDLHSLESVVVKVKPIQVNCQDRRKFLQSISFQSVSLGVAVLTEESIRPVKAFELKHLLQTVLDALPPLNLDN